MRREREKEKDGEVERRGKGEEDREIGSCCLLKIEKRLGSF